MLLNRKRKSFVGVQWSGRLGEKADASSHDMTVLAARCDEIKDVVVVLIVQMLLSQPKCMPGERKAKSLVC